VVDELLERFPGPITLHPSQRKWLAILAGCAVFVGTQAQRALARANVGLVGRKSALPDTYGMTAEDLARLMSVWRRKALS